MEVTRDTPLDERGMLRADIVYHSTADVRQYVVDANAILEELVPEAERSELRPLLVQLLSAKNVQYVPPEQPGVSGITVPGAMPPGMQAIRLG